MSMETLTAEAAYSKTERLLSAAAFSNTIDMSGFESRIAGSTIDSGEDFDSFDSLIDGPDFYGFNSLLDDTASRI